MGARSDDAIILIPGFFGFSELAGVSYFDAVDGQLSQGAGIARNSIVHLAPPPTGALWRRVNVLCKQVESLCQAGKKSIHLIGHSTGGLDIRLFLNEGFDWPGGPPPSDRAAMFGRIGRAIAISAPHAGTPIATRLSGAMECAIPLFWLLSILAKHGRSHVAGASGAFARAHAALEGGALSQAHVDDALVASGLGPTERTEIGDYLAQIADDHVLIEELTPTAMDNLNSALRPESAVRLHNFVTVAPPPDRVSGFGAAARALLSAPARLVPTAIAEAFRFEDVLARLVQRAIYAFAYDEADPRPGPFPSVPPWVASRAPEGLERFRDRARDGVVPVASQSAFGEVEQLVYGDHLDVVGHYDGGRLGGVTVFNSGSGFDDVRMETLWGAIARML